MSVENDIFDFIAGKWHEENQSFDIGYHCTAECYYNEGQTKIRILTPEKQLADIVIISPNCEIFDYSAKHTGTDGVEELLKWTCFAYLDEGRGANNDYFFDTKRLKKFITQLDIYLFNRYRNEEDSNA